MKFRSIIILFVLLAAGCNGSPQSITDSSFNSYSTTFHIGTQTLSVALASTDAEREQGLSGQRQLADNQGMLFDFRNASDKQPGFWMKDMKFNLDFIWINNNIITGITPDVSAPHNSNEPLILYYPPSNVTMVVEVNSGWTKAHGIKSGDAANF